MYTDACVKEGQLLPWLPADVALTADWLDVQCVALQKLAFVVARCHLEQLAD